MELYTAFTLGEERVHHLVLEAADQDLSLLFSQSRPANFNDQVMLRGVWGISSAIQHVHNYIWKESNLNLIGCHFDLKPANILIRGTDFLLSDFGVSRLKPQGDGSSSKHKGGFSDYAAPESFSIDDITTMRARSSSDIWSLGCIFTELASYMLHGEQGVRRLREAREISIAGGLLQCCIFYCDKTINPEVEKAFHEMEKCANVSGLVCLTREMLNMDPSRRPLSSEVSRLSFLIWANNVFQAVSDLFLLFQEESKTNAIIEFERFGAWVSTSRIREPWSRSGIDWTSFPAAEDNFKIVESVLKNFQEALLLHESPTGQPELDDSMIAGFEASLALNVDRLWNTQPPQNVATMIQTTTSNLLKRGAIDSASTNHSTSSEIFKHVRFLTAMKQITKALDNDRGGPLRMLLDRSSIRIKKQLNMPVSKRLGCVEHPDGTQTAVLIEPLDYADAYIDHPETLIRRVDGLTLALAELNKLDRDFPLLPCEGFCRLEQQAFGLVFRIPGRIASSAHSASFKALEPMALGDIIRETRDRKKRPPLDGIFTLALILADAVATLHEAKWLHKNLCSFNVLFFPTDRTCVAESITSPYVSGFNFSRESSQSAFSIGPNTDKDASDYQHPEYKKGTDLRTGVRFREEFDYYSLGLISLEIGLWSTLRHLLRKKTSLSPEEIRDFLLDEIVPELGSYVGRRYQDAVTACLDGTVGGGLERFREIVLDFLRNPHPGLN